MPVEAYEKALRGRHTVQSTLPDFPTRARFAGLRRLLSRNGILIVYEGGELGYKLPAGSLYSFKKAKSGNRAID